MFDVISPPIPNPILARYFCLMAERKRLTSAIASQQLLQRTELFLRHFTRFSFCFFFFFSSCHEKQKKNPTRLSLERVSWVFFFFGIYQLAASRLLKNQKVLDADIDEEFNEIN